MKALNKAEPSKVSIYNVGTGRGLTMRAFFFLFTYLQLILCSYKDEARLLIKCCVVYMKI